MAISTQKRIVQTLAVATTNLESLDVTCFSGACISLVGPGAGAGTIKLQKSNDNTNWLDITGASEPLSAGFAIVEVNGIQAGFIRPVVTLSAGAGSYTLQYLGKDI